MSAQVTLPSTGTLSAVSTWRSVQLPTAAIPAGTGYAAYRLQLSWTNVSGATSGGARFMLTNEPVTGGTLEPFGTSAFAYVAPTSSVWFSGARSDSQPASLTSIGALSVPVIRGVQAPPVFLCYRQMTGSASWSVASVTLLSPIAPVVNDQPSGAVEIVEPSASSGGYPVQSPATVLSNASALVIDEPVPSCVGAPRRVVWYRFTPTKRGTYRVSACEDLVAATQVSRSIFVAVFGKQGGVGGEFVSMACQSGACGTAYARGDLTTTLEAGTTYYIAAGLEGVTEPATLPTSGLNALSVAIDLVQALPPAAVNQSCDSAVVIAASELESGVKWTDARWMPTAQISRAPMQSCGEGESFYSLWYTLTPMSSGSYRFSTCASDAGECNLLRTRLQVFSGSCASGTLSLQACDDGLTGGSCGDSTSRASLEIFLNAGAPVYVVVSRPGATGLQPGETVAQLAVQKLMQGQRCSPADIADDAGNPLPSGLSNNGVNEGDYNAFFSAEGFFAGGAFTDIAYDDGEPLPPFGQSQAANNGVNEGDYNAFFNSLFLPCP